MVRGRNASPLRRLLKVKGLIARGSRGSCLRRGGRGDCFESGSPKLTVKKIKMIIYSTTLFIDPQTPLNKIVDEIEKWARFKTKSKTFKINKNRLSVSKNGTKIAFYRFKDNQKELINFHLSHGDEASPGRLWMTEVGARTTEKHIECSILLETSEISTLVANIPETTVPFLVHNFIKQTSIITPTPKNNIFDVSEEGTSKILKTELVNPDRHYPIVLVSGNSKNDCLVNLENLRYYLEGIACVYFVPIDFNTSRLFEQIEGVNRFFPKGGGISIVHPSDKFGRIPYAERFFPDTLINLIDNEKDVAKTILTSICHRYNLSNKLRHITREMVLAEERNRQISKIISGSENEKNELQQWIEEYESEINRLNIELNEAQQLWHEADDEKNRLALEVNGLKYELNYRPDQGNIDLEKIKSVFDEIADSILIEKSLSIIERIFKDRIIVLESARRSSKESAQFRHKAKAFSLLWRLCNEYWTALASGEPDSEARKVFGQDEYSAKESESVSNNERARRMRTFQYGDESICMEKHLKFGVKDSVVETIRIHFEWIADEKKIVIGYCGKHLPQN